MGEAEIAIVINPALSTAASGNLGGINYTRWRGRAVARARTTWIGFTPSTQQLLYKGKLEFVVKAWGGSLTAAQRSAWVNAAASFRVIDRFGRQYTCTGYQMFCKLNMQRSVAELPFNSLPPITGIPFFMEGLMVGLSGVPGIGRMHAISVTPAYQPDMVQYWQAGPFDSPGRHALGNEFLLLGIERPFDDEDTAALTIGKYYWFRARGGQDSGEVGNFHEFQWQAA